MITLRIYTFFLYIGRVVQISFRLVKYVVAGWFKSNTKDKKPVDRHTTPARMRMLIEDLGPTFIKFGQILADRPDVISEPFRIELKKLQTTAKPMSDNAALRLIEKELNSPIGEVFSEFDTQHIASASIGQVYQGKLKNGLEVIVKIQRPNIERKVKTDVALMRKLARRLAISYPSMAAINIVGVVDEFGKNIMDEMNYHHEAANVRRFQNMFKNSKTVHIPHIFMKYTTHRMLVMEKINGIAPDNIPALREAGYDLHTIAVNGANALLTMILEHGFFHADPHAGNIFITKGNVITFIDYGMTATLKPRDINFLSSFTIGFARKDPHAIAVGLQELCSIKYFEQHDDLEFDLNQIIRNYEGSEYEELDFAKVMQDCLNVIVKHHLQIPSEIFMLVKALASIQKFAGALDPSIALMPLIMPYAKHLVLQKYHPKKLALEIYNTVSNYVSLIRDLPTDVGEILFKLKEGRLTHDIHLHEANVFLKTVRQLGFRIIFALLIVGAFVGSAIMVVWGTNQQYARVALIISSILLGLLLIRSFFRTKI